MRPLSSSSRSKRSKPPLEEAELVLQLNALLTSLHIPIPLISPTDLTPSLLVAILESLIGIRIPVIERQDNSKGSKVQNMKIFIGVLETDLLQMDVGLSELDPRRLADGEWEEVMFIAELLCWVGRRMKLIKKNKPPSADISLPVHYGGLSNLADSSLDTDPATPTPRSQRLSPKSQLDFDAASIFQTGTTITGSTRPSQRNISPFTSHLLDDESMTSFNTADFPLLQEPFQSESPPTSTVDDEEDDDGALSSVSDILGALSPFRQSGRQRSEPPQCIHEVSTPPSLLFSRNLQPSPPDRPSSSNSWWCPEHLRSSCTCDLSISPVQSPPVRYTGYISQVDEESEIASFELSRSMSASRLSESSMEFPTRRAGPSQKQKAPSAQFVKEQYARTLELLNERARLLTQLAEIKNSNPHG